MVHLTTIDNIKKSTRFVGQYIDDKRIEPYIGESEQMDIKRQIGDSLFLDLLRYVEATDKTLFPDYSTLLNGGVYTCRSSCGITEEKSFKGLIEALNYYVWARLVKNNNYTLTRFGFVNKTEDHSANADLKERLVVEKDTLSIADQYLLDCINYLRSNKEKFPLFRSSERKNRYRIKVIGD